MGGNRARGGSEVRTCLVQSWIDIGGWPLWFGRFVLDRSTFVELITRQGRGVTRGEDGRRMGGIRGRRGRGGNRRGRRCGRRDVATVGRWLKGRGGLLLLEYGIVAQTLALRLLAVVARGVRLVTLVSEQTMLDLEQKDVPADDWANNSKTKRWTIEVDKEAVDSQGF